MQKSPALGFAETALASVVTLEANLAAAQRLQDGLGDVVAAFFALAIVTRQREEGGRMVDLNTANVRGLRHDVASVLFFDVEAQALEAGNFALETCCFVLAASPFTGALGSFTESSMVHEFLKDEPNRRRPGEHKE